MSIGKKATKGTIAGLLRDVSIELVAAAVAVVRVATLIQTFTEIRRRGHVRKH